MVINNKVWGAGVSAAIVTVLVWAISATGHSMPPEVATALVGVVSAIVGFIVPSNQVTDPAVPPTPAAPAAPPSVVA